MRHWHFRLFTVSISVDFSEMVWPTYGGKAEKKLSLDNNECSLSQFRPSRCLFSEDKDNPICNVPVSTFTPGQNIMLQTISIFITVDLRCGATECMQITRTKGLANYELEDGPSWAKFDNYNHVLRTFLFDPLNFVVLYLTVAVTRSNPWFRPINIGTLRF